jgi:hypothetical protein
MINSRTCFLWVLLTALHTWLFFNQQLGLNALVFSTITVALITWYHQLWRVRFWQIGAGLHLISAVAVFWHFTGNAGLLYHVSSFLLAGFVFATRNSPMVALFNGILASLGVSFVKMLDAYAKEVRRIGFAQFFLPKVAYKKAHLYLAPATVTLIFYILYSSANPDFWLNIAFPAWDFDFLMFLYILFGLIFLSPLFLPWGLQKITDWDLAQPEVLKRTRLKSATPSKLGLVQENRQGVVMFAMLNALILVFLCFNVLQIFIPSLSGVNRGHSEQVHQGFDALVISLISAILLIMYYFRANQNFFDRKTRLVQLAVMWIALNALLALFTCYKNVLYVDAFGLTHKRIWVFIGMFLTGIGLFLTLLKIKYLKTNWYLIRQNSWVLYFVMTFYILVDWDRLITWYNPNYAREVDVDYIVDNLGSTKLPYLTELVKNGDPRMEQHKFKLSSMTAEIKNRGNDWRSSTIDERWLEKELANPKCILIHKQQKSTQPAGRML